MGRRYLLLAILLLCVECVNAATIYGSVYDPMLRRFDNAVVEIDTNPKQRQVAENATYRFSVPYGDYTIRAYYGRGLTSLSAEENLTIVDDGFYILDLFLYPDFPDEYGLFPAEDPKEEDGSIPLLLIALSLGALAAISFVSFILMRAIREKGADRAIEGEEDILDDDLKKILKLLMQNQGRMLQKDLRQHFTYTDAKVSLMLTELEDMGRIRRIKKGRGNLIVLVRKQA